MRLKSSLYINDGKTINSNEKEIYECLYDWGVRDENRKGFIRKFKARFPSGNPSKRDFEDWISSEGNNDCRLAWQAIQNAPTK